MIFKYSLVVNKRGVQIVGEWEIFLKSSKRGVQISGRGELENPYLKIRYKIMSYLPILELIHSFSTSIYLWHTEISQNILIDIILLNIL